MESDKDMRGTPDCINIRLTHLFIKFGVAVGEEGRERERRILGRGLSVLFGLFSWHCIGYLY
jgi:hypothetical protein